ncbi:coproporphyrinogen III oxidase [Spirochaetia bacterium]|nr:coproporphyrinogen III oxidase [Spirochaetia bacterium]
MTASLYLHIPFCSSCCDYCDFYSIPLAGKKYDLDLYVDTLVAETEKQIRRFGVKKIPTVYIGGGTPSVLGAERISRLLRGLRTLWINTNEKPLEITLELNPESAGEDLLAASRDGGVNRLSMGVQTFHEPSRQAINRIGEAATLSTALTLAADFFPGAFSVDLIAGLPFQDEKILLNDIDRIAAYEPAHVSLYSLTVEEGTPLALKAGTPGFLPNADDADSLWIKGRDALERLGYKQYEVSNFSQPQKECLHNIRYWRMENWLGVGPAASGTIINDDKGTGLRFTYVPEAEPWLAGNPPQSIPSAPLQDEEFLDRLTLMKESILMGFRYARGPDNGLFQQRFGMSIEEAIPKALFRRRSRKDKFLFLDSFLRDAFQELDERVILKKS